MNDKETKKSIKVLPSVEKLTITPGSKAELDLIISNVGEVEELVDLSIQGVPMAWLFIEKPSVQVPAGEERKIVLSIQPLAPPRAQIGRFSMRVQVASRVDPGVKAQCSVSLTVAGYEEPGRVGVLLEQLNYSAKPGEGLGIPVVLINQGLTPDTFHFELQGLETEWLRISSSSVSLAAGEATAIQVQVSPPQTPETHAGRRAFQLLVTSDSAPEQVITIHCSLSIMPFTRFISSLDPERAPDGSTFQVMIENLSNLPEKFTVTYQNSDQLVVFDPPSPQEIALAQGLSGSISMKAKAAKRPWVGGEFEYKIRAQVQSSSGQEQSLKAKLTGKAFLPTWLAVAGACLLVVLVLFGLFFSFTDRDQADQEATLIAESVFRTQTAQVIPLVPSGTPLPTPTVADPSAWLIGRNWFLVSINNSYSAAGAQEPFTLFQPDGFLTGYTGCNNLSGNYQTNFNQIKITNLTTSGNACPDSTLQAQERSMIDILNTAQTYQVSDTVMQIVSSLGFMNYSLTPIHRPEEVIPPSAVIAAPAQAYAGQVVSFDGSQSIGQAPIVSWRWDFGDGAQGSGAFVQHVYSSPGTYQVQLTVADQRGIQGSTRQPITIVVIPTPTSPPTSTPPPTPTALPTDMPTAIPQPTPTPAPTVTQPPPPIPPQAAIIGPSQGYVAEPVTFDATASRPGNSPIVSYAWDFGDGVQVPPTDMSTVIYIYTLGGTYQVTVITTDANGLSSSASRDITVTTRLDTAVWTLVELNGEKLLPGTAITLQFQNGQIAGFSGCNTYTGSYTATDNGDGTYSVSLANMVGTQLACPQEIMSQESMYLAQLQAVEFAQILGNMLNLSYAASATPQGQSFAAGTLQFIEASAAVQ